MGGCVGGRAVHGRTGKKERQGWVGGPSQRSHPALTCRSSYPTVKYVYTPTLPKKSRSPPPQAQPHPVAAAGVELREQLAHGGHSVGVKLPCLLGVNWHADLAGLGVHAEGGLQMLGRWGDGGSSGSGSTGT